MCITVPIEFSCKEGMDDSVIFIRLGFIFFQGINKIFITYSRQRHKKFFVMHEGCERLSLHSKLTPVVELFVFWTHLSVNPYAERNLSYLVQLNELCSLRHCLFQIINHLWRILFEQRWSQWVRLLPFWGGRVHLVFPPLEINSQNLFFDLRFPSLQLSIAVEIAQKEGLGLMIR